MDISLMALAASFLLTLPLWMLCHKIFPAFSFSLAGELLANLAGSLIAGYLVSAMFFP